jgi:hypothetical protein
MTIDGNATASVPDSGGVLPLIAISALGLWSFRRWKL